jgi:tRNA-splicing ligase RtcB
MMSRSSAKKGSDAGKLVRDLEAQGISVMARSKQTLTEEAPEAYKNVDVVARVVHQAGVGRLVARLRPLGVIKG